MSQYREGRRLGNMTFPGTMIPITPEMIEDGPPLAEMIDRSLTAYIANDAAAGGSLIAPFKPGDFSEYMIRSKAMTKVLSAKRAQKKKSTGSSYRQRQKKHRSKK